MKKKSLLALGMTAMSIFAVTFALTACGEKKHTEHTWDNGVCTVCHEAHPEADHVDTDRDGKCDVCEAGVSVVFTAQFANDATVAGMTYYTELIAYAGGADKMNIIQENTLTLKADGTYEYRKVVRQTQGWDAFTAMGYGEAQYFKLDVTYTGTYTRIGKTDTYTLKAPAKFNANNNFGFFKLMIGDQYGELPDGQFSEATASEENVTTYLNFFVGEYYDVNTTNADIQLTVNRTAGSFAY